MPDPAARERGKRRNVGWPSPSRGKPASLRGHRCRKRAECARAARLREDEPLGVGAGCKVARNAIRNDGVGTYGRYANQARDRFGPQLRGLRLDFGCPPSRRSPACAMRPSNRLLSTARHQAARRLDRGPCRRSRRNRRTARSTWGVATGSLTMAPPGSAMISSPRERRGCLAFLTSTAVPAVAHANSTAAIAS